MAMALPVSMEEEESPSAFSDFNQEWFCKSMNPGKRRMPRPLAQADFDAVEMECDLLPARNLSISVGTNPYRRIKLSKKAQHALITCAEIMADEGLLEMIFQNLDEVDLRSVADVSVTWRRLAYKIIRERTGNRPFILYWKNKNSRDPKRPNLKTYFHDNMLKSYLSSGVNEVAYLISFTTDQLDFYQIDFTNAGIGAKGIKYLFVTNSLAQVASIPQVANRKALAAGSSKWESVKVSNYEAAIQTICIPKSIYIELHMFSIPLYQTANTNTGPWNNGLMQHHATDIGNLIGVGKTLKGLLHVEYYTDRAGRDYAKAYANRAGAESTLGIIVANADVMLSSDVVGDYLSASGMGIFGFSTTKVATVGFKSTLSNINLLREIIAEFFVGETNGFVIMVYRLVNEVGESLLEQMKSVFGNIPMMAFETSDPIHFCGVVLDSEKGNQTTSLEFFDSSDNGLNFALHLIIY